MKKKLDHVNAARTSANVNKLDARWPETAYTNASIFVQNVTHFISPYYITNIYIVRLGQQVAIFSQQVSADDSAEEADCIETNEAVSMCSTAIFSLHVFAENK